MRVSVAGVLRAVMPTSSTATEAASEIATIFTWVARSAVKIVVLFITATFEALPSMACYSCSVVAGCLGSNALQRPVTFARLLCERRAPVATLLGQPVLNVSRRNANTKARRFGVSRTAPGPLPTLPRLRGRVGRGDTTGGPAC